MQSQGTSVIGPGRRRDDDLVAVAGNHLDGVLDGLHATTGDQKVFGIEAAPEVTAVIAGQCLAQIGNAALPGVKCFTLRQAFHHGCAKRLWGGQITLTRPEGDDILAGHAVHGDVDDATVGLDLGRAGQVFEQFGRIFHVHFLQKKSPGVQHPGSIIEGARKLLLPGRCSLGGWCGLDGQRVTDFSQKAFGGGRASRCCCRFGLLHAV